MTEKGKPFRINDYVSPKADAEASAFGLRKGKISTIIVVAAAQSIAAAAAQDQENDENPGASAKVVVAHIELPPFELHYSVWQRGNSCYRGLQSFFMKAVFHTEPHPKAAAGHESCK